MRERVENKLVEKKIPIPGTSLTAHLYQVKGEKLSDTVRKFYYALERYTQEHKLTRPQYTEKNIEWVKTLKDYLPKHNYDLDKTYEEFLENNLEEYDGEIPTEHFSFI